MYERIFRLSGHDIELAYDGASALEKLQKMEEVPAAILLDIMMPNMNGLTLIQNLRKNPRFAKVPIAVLTNSFYKEDEQYFLSKGADLYLVKIEHKADEVVKKIEELIVKGK